jgi:hypothetical protein
MCIACEMSFWSMIDALPEDARERILREQAERLAWDAPPAAALATDVQSAADERKP